ncbi:hypothetical protein DV30_10295 [Leptospira interrogans serovar Canicola str. Gui44]|nr:hypothetical protein CI00_07940 [Leptospira interrogans serovar Manilae]OQM30704.1 hypothetical protein DV30_10295 [Leptospira interrogans serovar Canicola str. Gui44]OQM32062.1 hypothetical protein DV38_05370 [Leptospira interrogans]
MAALIPFFLRVLRALVERRIVTQRFSSSKKILFLIRFTFQVLLVLIWEWETLFPETVPLPVTSHLLAIVRTELMFSLTCQSFCRFSGISAEF